jgi:hypothetical protein
VLLTLLLSACATAAGPPATRTDAPTAALPRESPSLQAPSSPSLAATESLAGTWDTGPYRTTENAGHDTWEWRVWFYEEDGVPFVTTAAWDPAREKRPSGGDHGPYHLLPHDQIAVGSADLPDIFTVYKYELAGNVLTLTWVRNDPLGPDASDTSGSFGTIRLLRE